MRKILSVLLLLLMVLAISQTLLAVNGRGSGTVSIRPGQALSRASAAVIYNSGKGIIPLDSQGDSNSETKSGTTGSESPKPGQVGSTDNSNAVGITTVTPTPPTDNQNQNKKLLTYSEKVNSSGIPTNKIEPSGKKLPSTHSAKPKIKPFSQSNLTVESILANLSSWWLSNPLNIQLWYLFFLAGLALYLFKLKQLRRPFLFLSIILLGFYLGSSLDPIGAVFGIALGKGVFHDSAIILLGLAVLLSFVLGRFFCGWICPLGAIQEFIHPETKYRSIPSVLDQILKYIKFIVLLVFLYFTWRTGENLWSKYEPLKSLVYFNGSAIAVMVLIFTLGISFLIERPFCRYICPLGAILSVTSRLAPFRMRPDAEVCMVCGKCTTGECPMNSIDAINPVTDLPEIDTSECIVCLRCQKVCQRSALRVSRQPINRMTKG